MDSYSHGPFEISGYKVIMPSLSKEQEIVEAAWNYFQSKNMSNLITNKAHESLHAVYFNYTNQGKENMGYDMLIGYITQDGALQKNSEIITLKIPAQDYQYLTITENIPTSIGEAWANIRQMSASELPRNYGYDLDMYSEDSKSVTVAVSVRKDAE